MGNDYVMGIILLRFLLPVAAVGLIGLGFALGRWGGMGGAAFVAVTAIALAAQWWRHR